MKHSNIILNWKQNFLQKTFISSESSSAGNIKSTIANLLSKNDIDSFFIKRLNILCKKIDVNKKLFSIYDDELAKALSTDELDDEGWKGIIILFFYSIYLLYPQYVQKKSSDIRGLIFKLLNSLYKIFDLIPGAIQIIKEKEIAEDLLKGLSCI